MKLLLLSLAVCLVATLAALPAFADKPRPPLSQSTQIIVVTTTDWNAVPGTLQRYERTSTSKPWKPVGDAIQIVVGKTGLAWGLGITPSVDVPADAPIKKEGDGKSPAGIFPLTSTFGYATQPPVGWKMPYTYLSPTVECVDDPHSRFYNQIVDRAYITSSGGSFDWNSSEQMRRNDALYTWGAFVAHNSGPATPGAGSCIFLHIWRDATNGTVGCTAMQQPNVETVLGWLDPDKKPLLVQMPMAQYRKYADRWKLPALPPASAAAR